MICRKKLITSESQGRGILPPGILVGYLDVVGNVPKDGKLRFQRFPDLPLAAQTLKILPDSGKNGVQGTKPVEQSEDGIFAKRAQSVSELDLFIEKKKGIASKIDRLILALDVIVSGPLVKNPVFRQWRNDLRWMKTTGLDKGKTIKYLENLEKGSERFSGINEIWAEVFTRINLRANNDYRVRRTVECKERGIPHYEGVNPKTAIDYWLYAEADDSSLVAVGGKLYEKYVDDPAAYSNVADQETISGRQTRKPHYLPLRKEAKKLRELQNKRNPYFLRKQQEGVRSSVSLTKSDFETHEPAVSQAEELDKIQKAVMVSPGQVPLKYLISTNVLSKLSSLRVDGQTEQSPDEQQCPGLSVKSLAVLSVERLPVVEHVPEVQTLIEIPQPVQIQAWQAEAILSSQTEVMQPIQAETPQLSQAEVMQPSGTRFEHLLDQLGSTLTPDLKMLLTAIKDEFSALSKRVAELAGKTGQQ